MSYLLHVWEEDGRVVSIVRFEALERSYVHWHKLVVTLAAYMGIK
jgi:hypothetical protein